jgi:WD40 repeat protein
LQAARAGEAPEPGAAVPPAEKGAKDSNGDPLPAGAVARMGTDRLRHGSSRGLLAFTPDGKGLVSSGLDGVIHFWDAETGKELRRFKTLPQQVQNAALSPDQRLLAAIDFGGAFGLFAMATGKKLDRVKLPNPGNAHRLAFSPDSKTLAVGDFRSAEVLFFDAGSGELVSRFQPQPKPRDLTRLGFAPDGGTLLAKSSDGVVHFWDLAAGKEVRNFRSNENLSPSYAVSPDGKTFAFGEDLSVVLWDLVAGKKIDTLDKRSRDFVNAVAFSPDGKILAAGGFRSVSLWDVATRKELHELGPFQVRGAYLLRFSPDGKTLATAGDQESVRLWDVATGRELRRRPEGHTGAVRVATFSGDGRLLATLGSDRSLRVWDSATGKPTQTVSVGGECLDLDRDGATAVVGDETCALRYFELASGKEVRKIPIPEDDRPKDRRGVNNRRILGLTVPPGSGVTALVHSQSFVPTPATVARVVTLDPGTGKETFRGPGHPERCLWTLSPDGRLQASYNQGRRCDIRDVKTGRQLLGIDTKSLSVYPAVFSPDGQVLAGVCHHGRSNSVTVALWEVATGAEIRRFRPAIKGDFAPLAFTPDGSVLAAGGNEEGGVQLWDLATGEELVRFQGYGDAVICLRFSEDVRRLAGGFLNGTALVWDTEPAARPAVAKGPADLEQLWTDLGKPEAAAGQAALWSLARRPAQAIPLLKSRLRPATAADARRVGRLIADLDNDRFEVREAAAKELEQQEPQADVLLKKALTDGASAEVRRRVESLLARPRVARAPETLRRLRAVQALEYAATPEARDLLRTLAGGSPDARETEEAKAALDRLAARPKR